MKINISRNTPRECCLRDKVSLSIEVVKATTAAIVMNIHKVYPEKLVKIICIKNICFKQTVQVLITMEICYLIPLLALKVCSTEF